MWPDVRYDDEAIAIKRKINYDHAMQSAFSLVELSIVLVILGLLTGGIIGGQSLIRSAELRSVATEYADLISVTQGFRDKYMALPGDMRNATSFWGLERVGGGAQQATCVNNAGAAYASTENYATGACDGNGDGRISHTNVQGADEMSQFWQHLYMAGLKPQASFDGTGGGNNNAGPSLRAKITRGYWSVTYNPSPTGGTGLYLDTGSPEGQIIYLGAPQGGMQPQTQPVMTPAEAWNLDVKMDDGIARQGKMQSTANGGGAPVAWNLCRSGANYPLDRTDKICSVFWANSF
ncbi:MAG: hypothetical protein DI582_03525 [Azospirillum brasilense]|nr:MAG: hypothetical protein DI582_03525 [Azospirillum brasilense]